MAVNLRATPYLTNISEGFPLKDQINGEAVHESDSVTIPEESNEDGKIKRVVIEKPERGGSPEEEAKAEKVEKVARVVIEKPERGGSPEGEAKAEKVEKVTRVFFDKAGESDEEEKVEQVEVVSVRALPRIVEGSDSIINWGVLIRRLQQLFMSKKGLFFLFCLGGGVGAGTFAGIRQGVITPKEVKNFLGHFVTDNRTYTIASVAQTRPRVESVAFDTISLAPPRVNLTEPPTWWKKINPRFNSTLEKQTELLTLKTNATLATQPTTKLSKTPTEPA